ncbi:hypothetical protein [Aneurinibacillus aneurinilyticus]|uniref:hypothetical protein n=1 Tax=Aneurinibacillus aneurinilyticus TaxID=1391 RepID=UPI002E1FD0B1|nr:hypothetical protein [Aneurinibacillus aneurinilyticus]
MNVVSITVALYFFIKWVGPIFRPEDESDLSNFTIILISLGIALIIMIVSRMKGDITQFEKLRNREIEGKESPKIIEVLSIVKANEGFVTIADVAGNSELNMRESEEILYKFQKEGHAQLKVAETGDVIFYFPGFRLASLIEQKSNEEGE